MIDEAVNPFAATKAVDLSVLEIRDTWVDLPEDRSLLALGAPRSPMPMLILGGKGAGRTHLLRYFSYAVQSLRHTASLRAGFDADQYVGIFVQCEALNAARFSGRALDPDAWLAAFRYYMDVWLARMTLGTLIDLQTSLQLPLDQTRLLTELLQLVDVRGCAVPTSAAGFLNLLREFQVEVDSVINNAPLQSERPKFQIRANPGRLVFDLPRIFLDVCSPISHYKVSYLFDEVENLSTDQQRYINTLVRDKRVPVTMKIGCRTHGLRTLETLRDGEENRRGSEFEIVELDTHLRGNSTSYMNFSRMMTAKRLSAQGIIGASFDEIDSMKTAALRRLIDSAFETNSAEDFEAETTRFILERYRGGERPYLEKMRSRLRDATDTLLRGGMLVARAEVDDLISEIRVDSHPLIERANVFLLYKAWNEGVKLLEAARVIGASCRALLAGGPGDGLHRRILKHFRGDLLAQLLSECKQPQRYLGFETFVHMANGFPRHLLIVLKAIYRWSVFNGERPFDGRPVSMRSQQQGVLQASNWFFADARVVGQDPLALQSAMERLGGLLRAMRYSDKPVEPSLCAFACDESQLSECARNSLKAAEQTSLLLRVDGGHKNRNTRSVDACFQMNPMLAPRFDLPVSRRGVVELSPPEANALFEPGAASEFERVKQIRVSRMNAPFLKSRAPVGQTGLFNKV